jgi:cytochrome P450
VSGFPGTGPAGASGESVCPAGETGIGWEFDEVFRAMAAPECRRNPYPFYAQMRAAHPMYRSSTNNWYLFRYDDVEAALLDPHLSSTGESKERWQGRYTAAVNRAEARLRRSVVHADRPDHTRLRRLVNRALTARRVQEQRPRVQEIVDQLLDRVQAKGSSFDLISEFAYPLTITVICELVSIPADDHEAIRQWSRALVDNANFVPTLESAANVEGPMQMFEDYLCGLIARRRASPGPDLVSALIAAKDRGEQLNEDELLSMCFLVLAGGHETVRNLIGNGVLALLRNPDAWKRLGDKPTLVRSAVEELLRYDNPTQMRFRIVAERTELEGRTLHPGEAVFVMLGAANRDPERFLDPDRLDITRPGPKPLSFGSGPHFCLGAPVARLEVQVAIRTLVERFPNLRLETDDLEWRPNPNMRGVLALPVAF